MKPEQQTVSVNRSDAYLFNTNTSQKEIDSVIWAAFKAGDRKAFDYIFQKYIKLLYTYGGKITRDQGLVEDCIQDLFIELWQKREVVSDVESVKYYLLKSLRRRVVRKLTSGKDELPQDGDEMESKAELEFPAETTIIEEQIALEQHERLMKALAMLSKRQREAIYLKFYEKLSYEELAGIMDLGVKSAYNLIGKAINTLRKHL